MQPDDGNLSPAEVLARLIESLPLPVAGMDASLRVVIWNLAATRTFGWTYDEVAGRRNPLIPAELLDDWEEGSFRTIADGSLPTSVPITRQRRDGSTIELLMWSAAVRASPTSSPLLIGVFVDLSEMAEHEMRTQRARAEVNALSLDVLTARTSDDVLDAVRRHACAAVGAEHAEWMDGTAVPAGATIFSEALAGQAVVRGLYERDYAASPYLDERGFRFGGAVAIETAGVHGVLAVYSCNADLLGLGALPLATCAAVATAAIARLDAEHASAQSEVTLQLMADQLPALVWTTDRDLVFTAIRGRAASDVGLGIGTVGTPIADHLVEDPPQVIAWMRRVIEQNESASYSYTFRGRVFDARVDPLRAADGSVRGTVGVAFDVTEREEARREIEHLAARISTAEEEQRRRIARELHDEMGATLTALRLELDQLRRELGNDAHGRMESMAELLREAGQTVRRVSTELRPPLLEDFGLIAALETEFAQWQKRTGIVVEASLPADNPPLDAGRNTALYRIIQEALTNTARHAGATRVHIRLQTEGGCVVVEVCDDGRGITDHEATNASSMGLTGVRERAAAFGGGVTIEGTPATGTRITVRLPLTSGQLLAPRRSFSANSFAT